MDKCKLGEIYYFILDIEHSFNVRIVKAMCTSNCGKREIFVDFDTRQSFVVGDGELSYQHLDRYISNRMNELLLLKQAGCRDNEINTLSGFILFVIEIFESCSNKHIFVRYEKQDDRCDCVFVCYITYDRMGDHQPNILLKDFIKDKKYYQFSLLFANE